MTYTPPALPYYGPVYHSSGNGNLPLTRIVIHCTAGSDGKGAQGTAGYFRTAASGGSAHYITDSDEAIQCAYDTVVCWHAPPNMHSIGIEMCCSLTDRGQGHWTLASHVTMMHITAKLTAQKCIQYNVPIRRLSVAQVAAGERGITGHNEVSLAFGQSSHWDPGEYFPWPLFIAMVQSEANIITGTGDQPMSAAEVQQILNVLAGYESSAGVEGQRYAALQGDTDTLQARLEWFITVEANRYGRYEAIHTEDKASFAAIQTAIEKGSADEVLAINSLAEAVKALTAKLTPTPAPPPLP